VSEDSERGLEKYANEVAKALRARGETSRRPRPSSTRTEKISEGFLGLRHRTVTHHDDGGTPRFWIIWARRDSGEQAIYHPRPGSQTRGHSRMEGNAAILLENGDLRAASWREDPIGSYWEIFDIRALRLSGMTMLDYADKGYWKKARLYGNEQYREKFEHNYVVDTGPGLGLFQSLKRLHKGTGERMDGMATGMPALPRGPEWKL
jgi:hypothetical protein